MIEIVPLSHGHGIEPFELALGVVAGGLYLLVAVITNGLEGIRGWLADTYGDGRQERRDGWDRTFDDPRVADLWRRWSEGELTIEEAEQRAGSLLDQPRRELRERLEETDGIGTETSAAVARRYRSVGAVRSASDSELEEITGVGESTRRRIRTAVSERDNERIAPDR